MHRWIIAALASAFALAANAATAGVFFPPMVSGQYIFKVQPNTPYDTDGVPTIPPTRSLSITDAKVGAENLRCVDVGPTQVEQETTYTFNVVVPATEGRRRKFHAYAYSGPGCTLEKSERSDNAAFVFFGPPNKPNHVK